MGFGRIGPVLRPQAARLSGAFHGRPAGPPSPARQTGAQAGRPPSGFRYRQGERLCPMQTRKSVKRKTASGSRAGRPHASRPACALDAASNLPLRNARYASPARRRETPPAGPATRGCAQRENRVATRPARPSTSASGPAGREPRVRPRALAPAAARPPPRRGAPPASRAWRSGRTLHTTPLLFWEREGSGIGCRRVSHRPGCLVGGVSGISYRQ